MSTLHCALENEENLYVNKRKKIQHYRARSVEKRRRRRRKKNAKARSTEERRMSNVDFLLRVVCT